MGKSNHLTYCKSMYRVVVISLQPDGLNGSIFVDFLQHILNPMVLLERATTPWSARPSPWLWRLRSPRRVKKLGKDGKIGTLYRVPIFFTCNRLKNQLGTEKYRVIGDRLGTEYVACPQWGQNWGQSGDRNGDGFQAENHRVERRLFSYETIPNMLFSMSLPPASITSVMCWYTLRVTSERRCPILVCTYFSGAPAAIIIEQWVCRREWKSNSGNFIW